MGDEEMRDEARWIRSYVARNESGRLGTVCTYQGTSPEAIREHARRVGMPAAEVLPVTSTMLVRPDPDNA